MSRSSPANLTGPVRALVTSLQRFVGRHAHFLYPVAFISVFAIITFFLVAHFYATRIPHYDSVGSLLYGAIILAEFEANGWASAMAKGWELSNLSILQMMFVAVFSFILQPGAEYFHIYNIVFLFVMTITLAQLGRALHFTPVASTVLVAAFLTPDALYWWDIGVLDFRRDFVFYALVVSAEAALITAGLSLGRTGKVLILRGAVVGTLAGLLLLSRDNSPTYGFILVAAPAVLLTIVAVLRGRGIPVALVMASAFGAFLPFAMLFSFKLGNILDRLGNEFLYYGVGGDRVESFTGLLDNALNASFGGIPFFWNENRFSTLILFVFLIVALGGYFYYMRTARRPGVSAKAIPNQDFLRAGLIAGLGLYSFCSVYLLLTLGAGMRTNMPLIVSTAPFLSTTVLIGWIFAAALVLLRAYSGGFQKFRLFGAAAAALVLVALPVRAADRMFAYPDGFYTSHEDLTETIQAIDGPAVIAELEHTLFRIPAIQYYAVRSGERIPSRLFFEHEGVSNDFTGGVIEDPEAREAVFSSMRRAILCDADLILLEARLSLYEQEDGHLLLSRYGAPLIEDIRHSLAEAPRQIFLVGGKPTVEMINNTARSACA